MVAFCLLQLLHSELRQKGLDRIREVSRSGIAVFDALVSCKLMGRKPLYISTDRGSRTP
jgi:hypothetical protein